MRRTTAVAVDRGPPDRVAVIRAGTVALLLIGAAVAAHAQSTPADPGQQSPPQQIVPHADPSARANGIITPPPDVDPGMRAHNPGHATGIMPVIPPPGTPGGPPGIVPK